MEAAYRAKLEKGVYRKTHKDFKGRLDGKPSILVCRAEGTTIVTMEQLTEEELLSRAKSFKLV
jgi:hypothetical protein